MDVILFFSFSKFCSKRIASIYDGDSKYECKVWHEASNKTDEPTPWKFNSISDSAGVTGVYFTPHCAVQTLGENYSLHFRGSSGLNNTAEWDLPGHTVDLTFLFSLRSSTLLTVLRGAKQGWRMSNIEIFAPLSSLLPPVSSLVSLLWCL